ncbi:hypothetical protein [Streptobacillus moniliformis]|uniref:hypothetical protein n=1 Tax=Streptobacillus moniliformis TaxID=34105 RepID=UPI0007E40E1B|nr:hypothetical protein [Streptobacillus moniliformis]
MNNIVKPRKIFETVMLWLLSFCLLIKLLLMAKVGDIFYKLKGQITNQTDFVTLVKKLSVMTEDLKALEVFATIYRTFLLFLLITFACFVIFRIINKQFGKLLKESTIMIWVVITASVYYVYITKDFFYALRSITEKQYEQGLPYALYLMGRIQYILDVKYIIHTLTIIIFVSTVLAIILNVRTLVGKEDKAIWKKLNIATFVSCMLLISGLISWNIYIEYDNKIFKPFEYMVKNYTHKNDKIYLFGSVNMRKVNEKNIDPNFRSLYLNGVNYEVERGNEELKKGETRNIKVSFNAEIKEFLNLKTGEIEDKITIKTVPEIVKSIDEINVKSLFKYLSKYDERYSRYSIKDEMTGIYQGKAIDGNAEYYLIQKIKYDELSFSDISKFEENDEIYKLIYLGVFYRDGKEIVGLEGLNLKEGIKLIKDVEKLMENLKESKIEKVN